MWIRILIRIHVGHPDQLGQNWPLLKDEDFTCSLDVLYGGLGISELKFLIKNFNFFSPVKVFQFFVIKPLNPDRIRIRICQICWIRIRIRIETNADPQHCQRQLASNGKTSIVYYQTLSFFAFRNFKKTKVRFFCVFKFKIIIEPVRFASILSSFKIKPSASLR